MSGDAPREHGERPDGHDRPGGTGPRPLRPGRWRSLFVLIVVLTAVATVLGMLLPGEIAGG